MSVKRIAGKPSPCFPTNNTAPNLFIFVAILFRGRGGSWQYHFFVNGLDDFGHRFLYLFFMRSMRVLLNVGFTTNTP